MSWSGSSSSPCRECYSYNGYFLFIGFRYVGFVRTDYKFESLEEAEELVKFFYGPKKAKKVIENNWIILPECTGIWIKDYQPLPNVTADTFDFTQPDEKKEEKEKEMEENEKEEKGNEKEGKQERTSHS